MSVATTAQPRNKRRNFITRESVSRLVAVRQHRLQISRNRSADSSNRCHNVSAGAGCRATILQPHATAAGGRAMAAGVPSVVGGIHRRPGGLTEPSRRLRRPSAELHPPLPGFTQPFSGLSQPLPDADQSLPDASQELQDTQNKQFGINRPKNGVLHQNGTVHRQAAKEPSRQAGCFLAASRLCVLALNSETTLNP